MKKITKAILKKREKNKQKREFKEKLEEWKQAVIKRDKHTCQKCRKRILSRRKQHTHHIISLQNVKRKYPELLTDINNGILLCGYCHKFAPDSCHQGGFEFTLWLKKNKYKQFRYLVTKRLK